jgi:methyl-accepting chemotaxis protein
MQLAINRRLLDQRRKPVYLPIKSSNNTATTAAQPPIPFDNEVAALVQTATDAVSAAVSALFKRMADSTQTLQAENQQLRAKQQEYEQRLEEISKDVGQVKGGLEEISKDVGQVKGGLESLAGEADKKISSLTKAIAGVQERLGGQKRKWGE